MGNVLLKILDWSEVWALLIPLLVLQFRRHQDLLMKPVIVYVWLGFLINIAIDAIMTINIYFPNNYLGNNPLYNICLLYTSSCFPGL